MDSTSRLSGRLVAAGRALTGISQDDLAAAAGISIDAYLLLEARSAALIPDGEATALIGALESFGAVIIPEGDGMGAGVRLKFTRQDVKHLGRLENEGGIARPDDVP